MSHLNNSGVLDAGIYTLKFKDVTSPVSHLCHFITFPTNLYDGEPEKQKKIWHKLFNIWDRTEQIINNGRVNLFIGMINV